MNVADWSDRFDGERGSVTFEGKTVTAQQLHAEACRLATALIQLGVKPGDRVLIYVATRPEAVVASTAVWRCGGVLVPGYFGAVALEIAMIAGHCTPRAAIVAPDVVPKLAGLGIEHVIAIGGEAPGALSASELIERSPPLMKSIPRAPGDPAQISYTSGTTGVPKGAIYTHGGLNALVESWLPKPKKWVVRLIVQSPSAFGGLFLANRFGEYGRVVMLPSFDPQVVLETIQRERVTDTLFVPSMVEAIFAFQGYADYDTSSLGRIVIGGAHMSAALADRIEAHFRTRPVNLYGMTETGGAMTINDIGCNRESIGRLYPGAEIKIRDEDGREVAEGEAGEITARTPWMAAGYFNDKLDAATAAANAVAFRDGWVYTGDLGKFVGDELYLVGRRKEIIIQGGVNIAPREVADVLQTAPGVERCAVIGVPHDELGEEVVACVIKAAGRDVSAAELAAYCRSRLDARKLPGRIVFFETFPLSPNGKVKTKELVAQLVSEGATRQETPFARRLRELDRAARVAAVLDKIIRLVENTQAGDIDPEAT